MKKKFIIIIAAMLALTANNSFAQGRFGADSANCVKYLSFYQDYYKQKSYDDAVRSWRKAYQYCPSTASKNMYANGTVLIGRLISKNSGNAEYKKALIDTLFTLYEQSIQYNPKKAVETRNNKGIDLHKFVTDNDVLYTEYEDIIVNNQERTKPTFFSYDLMAAIEKYNAGTLDAQTVLETYQRNMDLVSSYKPKNSSDSTQVERVKKDLSGMLATSNVASCDKLIEIYEPQFKADPENQQLITMIVKTMGSVDDCQNNELFISAVTAMNKMTPSAASAYYLFKLYANQDNVNEAIGYMNEAINSPDCTEEQKEDYLYELASYCYRNARTSDALLYAGKLTDSQRYAGKAYFLMGGIWGSLSCGGNEIETVSHFWVAYDYMLKAKTLDSSIADDASRSMATFSSRFPNTADAFMYTLNDGDSYQVNCGGFRATTTVRTLK